MGWTPPPPRFVSADLGKEHVALTFWHSNKVARALKLTSTRGWPSCVVDFAAGASAHRALYGGELFVVEYPELRSHQFMRDNDIAKMIAIAGDLRDLAWAGGALAGALGMPVEHVSPFLWKGNLDADALTVRVQRKLSPEEAARVEDSADHNVFDSVGLGLWRIGRLHPERR